MCVYENDRSLLQKSLIKETIFCKRELSLPLSLFPEYPSRKNGNEKNALSLSQEQGAALSLKKKYIYIYIFFLDRYSGNKDNAARRSE